MTRPVNRGKASACRTASQYNVPNLERGLKMLELLLEHPEGMQQTEIASRLGCAKTSVYRISMTLTGYSYGPRNNNNTKNHCKRAD